ncbi:hypothetical protein EG329_002900 [Mollisiaceae sp. DMI_Dod_QoI]|nr:hypothetical protein EG329_002900 [Helotiales sp. DMI_Dod_QoI]
MTQEGDTREPIVRHDTKDNVPKMPMEMETVMYDITTGEQEHAQDERNKIMTEIESQHRDRERSKLLGEHEDVILPSVSPTKPLISDLPPSSQAPDADELLRLRDRIKELETRVGGIERTERRRRSSSSSTSSSDDGHEIDLEAEDGNVLHGRRTIAEVRECNWEQFKNRFSAHDGEYAIECLLAGDKLRDEIAHEQRRRVLAEQRATSMSDEKVENALPRQKVRLDKAWSDMMQSTDPKKDTEKRWLQRIRINSVPVLRRLGNATGETWSGQPRTFFRPFRALVHYHDKIKEELKTLEAKLEESGKLLDSPIVEEPEVKEPPDETLPAPSSAENADKESASSGPATDARSNLVASLAIGEGAAPEKIGINRTDTLLSELPDEPEDSEEEKLEQLMNSKEALQDLKCYVKFVEEKLMPLYHQFDTPENIHAHKIRFDDLWYLFRIGEHIYVPNPVKHDTTQANSDASKQPPVDQRIWRIFSLYPPNVNYKVAPLKESKGRLLVPEHVVEKDRHSRVRCYYIDYDGESYGPVVKEFNIAYFQGEKSIRELEVYPLRFAPDREEIRKEHQDLGRNFVQYLTERPLAYNGWTLITDPEGDSINNSNGDVIKYPEHIDSDVIVDFKEAFQTYPPWRPEFQYKTAGTPKTTTDTDNFFVIRWSDAKRTESLSKTAEVVVEDDDVDSIERNQNLEKDPYLKKGGGVKIFSDEDLLLLPRRLFAYALRERRFVHVDVRFLKPIAEHLDGFKSLKIDDDHRKMIQSLVSFHFKKKEVEKKGREISTQDLIRGKGRGLVILLHGVPGVGKTATAEAVAQANRKPLFPITCGDLGFTPESVETSLNEIFRLAHLWDCVLLLDEADIFLSQRTKDDLKRNALVSVFLRILEYFNGILFLTTNRPGTLDEAVKSRVHMSLYYSPLGESETEEIFRLNLARLKEIEEQRAEASGEEKLFIFDAEIIEFARQHYKKHINGPGRWNGRQIRNAFQIAASLAHYDGDANPGAQRQLGARHFQTVDEATTKYDQYRAGISGKLEDELAHEREERWDGFQSAERERAGKRRTSFYGGEEKRYANHGGATYSQGHVPSSQFQTPSPMTGYSKITPVQTQGPPPQMMSGMQYPQTPPSQRTGLPTPYHGAQQPEQSGYTTTNYGTPGGGQQLPPLQQHAYTTPQSHHQQVTNEPASYGQSGAAPSSDPRYGMQLHGHGEYAGRGGQFGGGQAQAPPPLDGRGPYDPPRDLFQPAPTTY